MRSLSILLVSVLLTLIPATASADHLVVERNATTKASPAGGAAVLSNPTIGTKLDLINNGDQQNGYYNVTDPHTHGPGWIYHTLVSRQPDASPPAGGGNTTPPAPVTALTGDQMRAHYIFLKQGNSTLLEFPCKAVLVDAGGEDTESDGWLLDYLTTFFASRTDLNNTLATVFVTHTHIDHNRDLENVVEHFTIDNYVDNGRRTGSGSPNANWMDAHSNDNGRHVTLEAIPEATIRSQTGKSGLTDAAINPPAKQTGPGTYGTCSGTKPDIRVLSGAYKKNSNWKAAEFKNENNHSLVIRVDFGSSSFLFPGDQEIPAIQTLLGYYTGTNILKVDILEVGHHGSANGTTQAQLQAVTPKIAVISMGVDSDHAQWTAYRYGHPRQSTVTLLDQAVSTDRPQKTVDVATAVKTFTTFDLHHAIYATGWDGTVVITADTSGHYDVQTDPTHLPH